MNFNKKVFTVKEFLSLPVYDEARKANSGEDFLLKGKQSMQQEYLTLILDNETEANVAKNILEAQRKNPRIDQRMKVQYYHKYKDGNVFDRGGTILFMADEKLVVKDDKVLINFGDDSLKFEHTVAE